MTSYIEIYANEIVPQLKAIDIMLKTGERISFAEVSELLGIPVEEILTLIGQADGGVDTNRLLELMLKGSGRICGLFRRELERGSPIIYTAEDVAYIYKLDIRPVRAAFEKLNAVGVTAYLLPDIFANIWCG